MRSCSRSTGSGWTGEAGARQQDGPTRHLTACLLSLGSWRESEGVSNFDVEACTAILICFTASQL